MNLRMKSMEIIVTIMSFLVYLPVKIAIRVYAIAPIPIPFAME